EGFGRPPIGGYGGGPDVEYTAPSPAQANVFCRSWPSRVQELPYPWTRKGSNNRSVGSPVANSRRRSPMPDTRNESPGLTRRAFLRGAAGGVAAGGLVGCGVANTPATKEASEEEMPTDTPTSRRYPLYRAKGTHRNIGRQHGEQAAEQIKAHVDFIARFQKLS